MYLYRKQRLLDLIDTRYEGMRKRICDASGWSEARISQLLSPTYRSGRAFSEKTARKLEEDLHLDPLYFDQGAKPLPDIATLLPEAMPVSVASPDSPTRTKILKVSELKLSAGITGFQVQVDRREGGTWEVPTRWVEKNGLNPGRLVAVDVKGESMEPSLYDGDLVVIDTSDTAPVNGLVYAVNYEGEAVIKRLVRDGGQWWLHSDNQSPRFPRRMCKGDECIIVGRVIRRETEQI